MSLINQIFQELVIQILNLDLKYLKHLNWNAKQGKRFILSNGVQIKGL